MPQGHSHETTGLKLLFLSEELSETMCRFASFLNPVFLSCF
jgi:hypothetical protein